MKLPLKSIKQFSECSTDLEKVLDDISSKIGAVEGYTKYTDMYQGIYIAQIVNKEEHPDADKLAIYEISIGESENIQVVAGDKSLRVGDKIAYIKPGYIVPSTYGTNQEIKIKAVNMRGVVSNGMLCSEKELNIGSNHTQVLVLEKDAEIGKTFLEYFDFDDTVVDIENKALTNRGDLFGIIGLARELSAAQGIPFVSPQWYTDSQNDINLDEDTLPVEVDNQASNLCPRYMAVTVDNVTVKDSPVWLKSLLIKSGFKPVNNIVDITNYIAIVTGQPLHAFDYDKLVDGDSNSKGKAHITVRLAKDGEKIHTLDNNLVELTSNNLVIADSTHPIAIGGVIGGMDTEIDENTKRIVLESATFDRFSIRRTSMELGIFTEAVTRYTRGQDPNYCLANLLKAVSLIKELAKGEVSSNIVDIYPNPQKQDIITLDINRLNTYLGTKLTHSEISEILKNIEYNIEDKDSNDTFLTVRPPLFRTDIFIEEDIYEDIGRIYGYENIKASLPLIETKPADKNRNIFLKSRIRNILSNSGCNELDTYNFTSVDTLKKAKQEPNITYHIKNSLSPELSLMRPSIVVSLLEKAQLNIQQNISPFCIYEFNIPHQKGYMDNFSLPKEEWHLSMLFSSKEDILGGNPYYQIKRYFEKVPNTLCVGEISYELISETPQLELPIWIKNLIPAFNSNSSALIKTNINQKEIVLGIIGNFDQQVKKNFKLPEFSSGLEINMEELKRVVDNYSKYVETSKFPSIWQDITFVVPTDTKYEDIVKDIKQVVDTKDRHSYIHCLDIYQKEEDTKNITLRITIEHLSKTLTYKEFEKIKNRLVKRIEGEKN
jgi:phenylalanyl-tRNA synthetase beta chain